MSTDEVAIITGAGSGIGRAAAQRLVADGFKVVLADLNLPHAHEAAAEIEREHPGSTVVAHVDVRLESDISQMVQTAIDSFGRLDVLVNNAGLGGAFGVVTETAVEDWDFTFEVLVRGVFLGIKHAVPHMPEGSRIVNIASIAAYNGSSGAMAYSAAKHAVIGITRSAAVELGPRGIRVNAVSPGVIRTPLMESGADPERLDRILPTAQITGRWGHVADIAGAIAFLSSNDSSFINGESIVVDGGLVAAGPGGDSFGHLGIDPKTRGLVGVNRGSTGVRSTVHKRLNDGG
ncbi:SDR family NAD(P)-dependent oxidoreductase [Cumulibacter soli]|uniref:SDR family NAD(P)-dependent oxidoreductase n=1 Tax=Cumulibacter soli TaxID=2546344 RepID=UPI0010686F91|nr:SDR family oxidoreductase [Cumulibacter soli]